MDGLEEIAIDKEKKTTKLPFVRGRKEIIEISLWTTAVGHVTNKT